MLLYAVTIFLSAFLLFQVQPIIARIILPWFGGSAGVWTTCMLFFQMVLLAGYAYSHGVIRGLSPKRLSMLHIALLAASLLVLPVIPGTAWKPAGGEEPTLRILGLLAVTIGLPYFMLSTTGPLLQAWFARDPAMGGRPPYRLYALSNLGSMLALLTYPVVVEPSLASRTQAYVWSGGFVLFGALCAYAAWRSSQFAPSGAAEVNNSGDPAGRPTALNMLAWAGLAACASSLLLSVTNHLTQNVASVPFLWILPLSLYLLTFILCFDSDFWYRRWLFLRLFAVAVGGMAYAIHADSESMPLKVAIPLFTAGLFTCCMVCHGELSRMKPHPRFLTVYFLMISLGGALGGLFVGVVAPYSFPTYYELPISLIVVSFLVVGLLYPQGERSGNWILGLVLAGAAVICQMFYFMKESQVALAAMVLVVVVAQKERASIWVVSLLLATGVGGYLVSHMQSSLKHSRVAARNFYGGLRVSDSPGGEDQVRTLTHGTINHGEQYLDPAKRRRPTTYYDPRSGVGVAIRTREPRGPLHVGVIGLGTGTLASYGRPGDVYRFYEINPLVINIAQNEFFFTRESGAKIDFSLGDARLSLEREPAENFDVLAVDAFSSDSIPVHLLTIEAFRLYFRHLKPDGVLAVHVSNKFLDLKPIALLAARELGKEARMVDTDDDDNDSAVFGSTWILITADGAFFATAPAKDAVKPVPEKAAVRLWTDDFSNLYRILK